MPKRKNVLFKSVTPHCNALYQRGAPTERRIKKNEEFFPELRLATPKVVMCRDAPSLRAAGERTSGRLDDGGHASIPEEVARRSESCSFPRADCAPCGKKKNVPRICRARIASPCLAHPTSCVRTCTDSNCRIVFRVPRTSVTVRTGFRIARAARFRVKQLFANRGFSCP